MKNKIQVVNEFTFENVVTLILLAIMNFLVVNGCQVLMIFVGHASQRTNVDGDIWIAFHTFNSFGLPIEMEKSLFTLCYDGLPMIKSTIARIIARYVDMLSLRCNINSS